MPSSASAIPGSWEIGRFPPREGLSSCGSHKNRCGWNCNTGRHYRVAGRGDPSARLRRYSDRVRPQAAAYCSMVCFAFSETRVLITPVFSVIKSFLSIGVLGAAPLKVRQLLLSDVELVAQVPCSLWYRTVLLPASADRTPTVHTRSFSRLPNWQLTSSGQNVHLSRIGTTKAKKRFRTHFGAKPLFKNRTMRLLKILLLPSWVAENLHLTLF